MTSPLESIIESGSKLWLDSVDPDLVKANRQIGATGATSNPIIVTDLIKSGRFDDHLAQLLEQGKDDSQIAWDMTDLLVSQAQKVFAEVWRQTDGDDGYVSFELDPLLEDSELGPPHDQRVARYIELGVQWAAGQDNRMIKVPATDAGLEALEQLVARGVTVNVTLVFSERQWRAAAEATWRGAQRRDSLDKFKSVYSIFVSRLDVYTQKHVPQLSDKSQGQVGILNAKRIWKLNRDFWQDKPVKLSQEMIFASTGRKLESDPEDKYVRAFVGSDIMTNPPATNDAVQNLGGRYRRAVDQMPPDDVIREIDQHVDFDHLEKTLMAEGIKKFADPQKALLELIAEKRKQLG